MASNVREKIMNWAFGEPERPNAEEPLPNAGDANYAETETVSNQAGGMNQSSDIETEVSGSSISRLLELRPDWERIEKALAGSDAPVSKWLREVARKTIEAMPADIAATSGSHMSDAAYDETLEMERRKVAVLMGAMKKIIERSLNDPLGTSKVIDMRGMAAVAMRDVEKMTAAERPKIQS